MIWSDHTRKFALLTAMAAMVLSAFSMLAPVESVTFGPENDPLGDSREQDALDIASLGSGNNAEVYMVFEDYSNGPDPRIFFKRSVNGGDTWQASIDFTTSYESGDKQWDPSIDAYREDLVDKTIAVVYRDSQYRPLDQLQEYVIVCRVSEDGGETWSSDLLVTPAGGTYPNGNVKEPDVCFDPNGNLYVAWTEKEGSTGNDAIHYSYSENLGITWSSPALMDIPSGSGGQNFHRNPSLACDGDYLCIAFESWPDYKDEVFMSRADVSSLTGGSLSFEEPWRVPPYEYPMYRTWAPGMVADDSALHIVWWDFSTDANGNNDQNLQDRACIRYTRSTDGGNTWEVGAFPTIILNSSTPEAWHSEPRIAIGESDFLAVTWIDHTYGYANLFAITSEDGGLTWSEQFRVNENKQKQQNNGLTREDWCIAVDSSNNIHCAWLERDDPTADRDIKHAKTIVNQPPIPIQDLSSLGVDETYGIMGWTPNSESDFKEYRIYIAETQGFSPDDAKWPEGNRYKNTTNQIMNQIRFEELKPDTTYYVKIAIKDQEGLTSYSNEASFTTMPINEPPEFKRNITQLYINEDSRKEGVLNLTYWKQQGWIIDDAYNGYSQLQFEIESMIETPNVTAVVRKVGVDNPLWYVDLAANVRQNWFGTEQFRIKVNDAGKDGGFSTEGDNQIGYSDWFDVIVNSTNDVPAWSQFDDINTGWPMPLQSTMKNLTLPEKDTGCIEDQPYTFALTCRDIDNQFGGNDYVTYSIIEEKWQERFTITVDDEMPERKSEFTFTPNNNDVPAVNFTVEADDGKGGSRQLRINLPVQNVNDPPFFTRANGNDIQKTGDIIFIQMIEEQNINFTVEAKDNDPIDYLTLFTQSDKPNIQEINDTAWKISVTAEKEDANNGYITFDLLLQDSQRTDLATLSVNISVEGIQDRPQWRTEKTSTEFTYDLQDQNEWLYHENAKLGGDEIKAEWGETVTFKAFAFDPDGDILNYTWSFKNTENLQEWKAYGQTIEMKFTPSHGNLSIKTEEKFEIDINITDGNFQPIGYHFEIFVGVDDDNDNDGLPDSREKYFFRILKDAKEGSEEFEFKNLLTREVWKDPLKLFSPNEDIDGDTYMNIEEIGFEIPRYDSERTEGEISIPKGELNPLNPLVYPGSVVHKTDEDEGGDESESFLETTPTWVLISAGVVIVIIIAVLLAVFIILRLSKQKDKKEDEELEKKIEEMDKRQKEISGLYGVQKTGDIVGPDQSTLDDLQLDLGGQVYHEEGSSGAVGVKKGKIPDKDKETETAPEKETGPQWESTGGPLFEETAPSLTFGESLDMDTVDVDPEAGQLDHNDIDDETLDQTMDSLLDAADEFKEDEVKDAGGKVLTSAVPMEEQIKNQNGQPLQGPRNPPPGQQAPPSAQNAPQGQAPPQPRQRPPGQTPPPQQLGQQRNQRLPSKKDQ